MENLFDLIIIGAGPAGLSAGIYAGRSKLKTLIIDKAEVGGQIRITSEVVNYPGILKTSGASMTDDMKKQAVRFGVNFLSADVIDVNFDNDIKEIIASDGTTYKALSVIIATGAKPRVLGFEGEVEYTGRGVGYCATCDGEFFTGLDVFVVGAGFAAAEEAIFLTRFAKKVTIIAREPEFTCSKTIADKVLKNKNIEVKFNTEVLSIGGTNVLKYAKFINNQTNEQWEYKVENPDSTFGVFVFVGYEPLSALFKSKVAIDNYGYITTDEDMKTNIEGVYAAGDIRPKRLRQLVTAVSDGAIAATSIERYVEVVKEKLNIEIENNNNHQTEEAHESFFDDDLKQQLEPVLERFENNISLAIIADDSKLSKEIESFANDFNGFSEKVSVNIYKKGENKSLEDEINTSLYPVMAIIDGNGKYSGVNFHGVPGGHEFNSFIIALYNVAGPGQTIDDSIMQRVKKLDKQYNLKVCVSLSCTMCPDVVSATQLIAANNNGVTAEMIDLSNFIDIKNKYSIMSVPAMIINDDKVVFGKKSLEELMDILEN